MGQQYAHLSTEERGTIMAMRAGGSSGREIARVLGRTNSTITRELSRNGHGCPDELRSRRAMGLHRLMHLGLESDVFVRSGKAIN